VTSNNLRTLVILYYAIVSNAGYSCSFPFLVDEAYQPTSRNKMNLYELMFSPDIQPPTLAIIGCLDTTGSVAVAAEMQCRYATRVFKVLFNQSLLIACSQNLDVLCMLLMKCTFKMLTVTC